jgi:hypothetical protein
VAENKKIGSLMFVAIRSLKTSELTTNRKTAVQLLPEMDRLNGLSSFRGSGYKR